MEEINNPVDSFQNNRSFKDEDSFKNSNLEVDEKVINKKISGAVFVEEDNVVECLPGFRFNPRNDELIVHYLRKKVNNQVLPHNLIKEIELYKYNPDDITKTEQGLAEKVWYFFTPRDKKYKNGKRPNRAAGDGYWKATGADKNIYDIEGVEGVVGHKKTLVFYQGKAPKGEKTNWIMHEFRVKDDKGPRIRTSEHDMRLDDWVLCKIYKKDDKCSKIVKQNRADNIADFQPKETRVPAPSNIGHFPNSNIRHLPTPNNSNIYNNIGRLPVSTSLCQGNSEIHSPFQKIMIDNDRYYNSDTSFNDHSFNTNLCAINNPQPLSYCYASSYFPYDQNNEDWSCITDDMLLDNPSLPNLDSIFPKNSQTTNTTGSSNNSQICQTPSNMSNSSG